MKWRQGLPCNLRIQFVSGDQAHLWETIRVTVTPIWDGVKLLQASLIICSTTSSGVVLSHEDGTRRQRMLWIQVIYKAWHCKVENATHKIRILSNIQRNI